MRLIFLFFLFFVLSGCSKPKTVFICGDHECINKKEAEQYFEENLVIEVKVINKNIKEEIESVELNLRDSQDGQRNISISPKKETDKNLKILSKNEINQIKQEIKSKKIEKKISKKNKKEEDIKLNKNKADNIIETENIKIINKSVSKKNINVVDVCTKLKKCSIDEISKYLLEEGRKKDFPNISKIN